MEKKASSEIASYIFASVSPLNCVLTKRIFALSSLNLGYEANVKQGENVIDVNDKVAQEIVGHALTFYNIEFSELLQSEKDAESNRKCAERASVFQALKHFVTDWAAEGEHERLSTFPRS